MESMYFASYAVIATVGVLIVGWAQYVRRKGEGKPFKLKLLYGLSALAAGLWAAAGATAFLYTHGGRAETVIMAGSAFGIFLSAYFAWHMTHLARQIEEDRKMLRDLATRDALTSSWNRRIFQENLLAEIKRAQTNGQPLSLLMFDIDDFHAVNERHGYRVGDGILRDLVARLFAALGSSGSLYRYGGEEIAVILPAVGEDRAEATARHLAGIISDQPYDVGDHGPVAITVSIGVATLGRDADSEEALIEEVIGELHAARHEHGTFVSVAPPRP